jgi:hypothetical protein
LLDLVRITIKNGISFRKKGWRAISVHTALASPGTLYSPVQQGHPVQMVVTAALRQYFRIPSLRF